MKCLRRVAKSGLRTSAVAMRWTLPEPRRGRGRSPRLLDSGRGMIAASTFAAFGLTVTCQFCVPGVVPGRAGGGRETHGEAVDDAELTRIWSAVKVSSDARVLRHD